PGTPPQRRPKPAGRSAGDRGQLAHPTPRQDVTPQGGPGDNAARAGRGGRDAAQRRDAASQQGVKQPNVNQQNQAGRTPGPPAQQNATPQQQGAIQQNQQKQRNQRDHTLAPSRQQNIARQQAVLDPNQASREFPRSAPHARAAIEPRAFSGGVLRNRAFADLARARDPGARSLASATFQGRFFNPQWR